MSYLTDFETIVRDERQMKAIIGVSTQEFEFLSEMFEEIRDKIREEEYEERIKE